MGFAMFRPCLLAAILFVSPAMAEDYGACRTIPGSPDNCVRAVACVGDQGLTFDGQARGWDQGSIAGQLSDDTSCTGTWSSDGPFSTGIATLLCAGDLTIDVIYYNQDNATGTTIGRGMDSRGRAVQAWTGRNVLKFLTPDGQAIAMLPCASSAIPIS